MSLAIATSILRSVAACWASLESNWSRSSLVTPSTIAATSAPSSRLDVLVGDGGVLDRVVQQRGGDRDVVEAEVGEDQRDPERVGDVGLTRAADLLGVGVAGDVVGLLDQRGVAAAVALAVGGARAARPRRRRVLAPPGQHRTAVGADLDARFRACSSPAATSTGTRPLIARDGRRRRHVRASGASCRAADGAAARSSRAACGGAGAVGAIGAAGAERGGCGRGGRGAGLGRPRSSACSSTSSTRADRVLARRRATSAGAGAGAPAGGDRRRRAAALAARSAAARSRSAR